MSFRTNQNHPLIQREQNYFVDRKLVTIHSLDRDINKWSNANHFEVELPQNLVNVTSLRLVSAEFPSNMYTFTNNYQNTKFTFSIQEDISGSTAEKTALADYDASAGTFTVEIPEGFYKPCQLVKELESNLNKYVTEILTSIYGGSLPTGYVYNQFRVFYDEPRHKIYIINLRDNFTLLMGEQVTYDNLPCNQSSVFGQYANWGLPYNLGYNKEEYVSEEISHDLAFFWDPKIFEPSTDNASGTVKYSKSVNCIDIYGRNAIYMELDKYNSMDEIVPYSTSTSSTFNNDYSGCVNSAFAKIHMLGYPFSTVIDSKNSFLQNITFLKVPVPTIRKMKFTFRYHDGTLVDFKNLPFSFVIEANQLLDEQKRGYSYHAPFIYST